MDKSLADRIAALHSDRDREEPELAEILADVRELEAAATLLTAMLSEWHAEFPDHVGDNERPALSRARAILTKTKGQNDEQ